MRIPILSCEPPPVEAIRTLCPWPALRLRERAISLGVAGAHRRGGTLDSRTGRRTVWSSPQWYRPLSEESRMQPEEINVGNQVLSDETM